MPGKQPRKLSKKKVAQAQDMGKKLGKRVARRVTQVNDKGGFKAGSGLGRATSLAAAYAQAQAVPKDSRAMRLPSVQSPQKTSVLDFTATTTANVNGSYALYALLFRTPTRPLWLSNRLAAGVVASRYLYRSLSVAVPMPLDSGELSFDSWVKSDNSSNWAVRSGGAQASLLLPNYCPAIDNANNVWFYIPTGGFAEAGLAKFTIYSTVSAGFDTCNYDMTFLHADSLKTEATRTIPVSGTPSYNTVTFNLPAAGWYRPLTVTYRNGTSANNPVLSGFAGGVTTGGTLYLPTALAIATGDYWDIPATTQEYATAPIIWRNTRATSVATLFANTTANLYKGGNVYGHRQLKSTEYGTGVFNTAYFSSIYQSTYDSTAEAERECKPLETGMYTFAKPDDASLQFRDWTFTATLDSVQNVGCVRFDSTDYVDVMKFASSTVGGVENWQTNLMITTSKHLEFKHGTQLWPMDVCRVPYSVWQQAMVAMAEMPNHYENPIHLAAIAAMARAAAQWALPVLAPYAKQAAMALATKAYSAFSNRMRKRP